MKKLGELRKMLLVDAEACEEAREAMRDLNEQFANEPYAKAMLALTPQSEGGEAYPLKANAMPLTVALRERDAEVQRLHRGLADAAAALQTEAANNIGRENALRDALRALVEKVTPLRHCGHEIAESCDAELAKAREVLGDG